MDTMKLLLGTIIALLVAALVMSWNSMNRNTVNVSAEDFARFKEEIATMKAEQQRQRLESRLIKGGTPEVAPSIETSNEIESLRKKAEAAQAKVEEMKAAENAKRDQKLADEETLLLDKRVMEGNNPEARMARLVEQALLVGRIANFVENPEVGNFATVEILMPEQVQVDTVLAIRRNKSGILGKLKVTSIENGEAVAAPLPGFGPISPKAGDELILPPE